MKHKESSALCGARPGTLSLDPAAFEKAGETFIRALCAQGAKRAPSRGPKEFLFPRPMAEALFKERVALFAELFAKALVVRKQRLRRAR